MKHEGSDGDDERKMIKEKKNEEYNPGTTGLQMCSTFVLGVKVACHHCEVAQ